MGQKKIVKKKKSDVGAVIDQINKIMKYEAVMLVDGKTRADIDVFPSGSIELDQAMDIGGYPVGRQIEIAGPPSVGKTHMAVAAMIEVQKRGGVVAFIDMESSIDLKRFEWLGLNTSELIISSPDYLEQGLNIIEALIPACDLIVYDSIGGSVPKSVYEGTAEDNHIGVMAKKLTQEIPKIARACEGSDCSVIWINQKRDSISPFPVADSDNTPGGNAFRHSMSIRLFVKRVKALKVGEDVIGHVISAKVAKNKCATPLKIADIYFLFEYGICNEWSVIDRGLALGVLEKKGTYIKDVHDLTLGQGQYNAVLFLKSNDEYYKQLGDEISKKLSIPK